MHRRFILLLLLLTAVLAGCASGEVFCPSRLPIDMSDAVTYSEDDELPFMFPITEEGFDHLPFMTDFAAWGYVSEGVREYHAAEDYGFPPGTPVYAMADGNVSYSGLMEGYGWLVIIDHPQANLYSLYGHLSPSRWSIDTGPVEKGQLIGYLGDEDENGGSSENPLVPHLHFGIRAGQRADYPGNGEWRWQAGWIKPCPQSVGWLQPSIVITGQNIPEGGFSSPEVGLWTRWGVELIMGVCYLAAGLGVIISTRRGGSLFFLLGYGLTAIIAKILIAPKSPVLGTWLLVLGSLALLGFIYLYVKSRQGNQSSGHISQ